jgi:hypothetical protein
MRVENTTLMPDQTVQLLLRYESINLYNDDYDLNVDNVYNTTLPDPSDEPPSVENVTVTEETFYYRLRTFTRLNVAFSIQSTYPWLEHVEIWVKIGAGGTYRHMFNVTDDFQINNVEEGNTYYIKFKVVSIWGVKQADGNCYIASKIVSGDTDAPQSLAALYATVNQNSINLWADRLSDPDVEVYEFRVGGSWASGLFLGSFRSPNFSLVGVRPGSHTFWCNTKGNNDLYGDTAVNATVSLVEPPDGWTIQSSTAVDDYV